MRDFFGYLYWPRTGEQDKILVNGSMGQIKRVSGSGFLNRNWEGQYLETLMDFCRQEGIKITLQDWPENSTAGPPPVGVLASGRPVKDLRS